MDIMILSSTALSSPLHKDPTVKPRYAHQEQIISSLLSIAALTKTFTIPCLLLILLLNSSCTVENILFGGETLYGENSLAYGANCMLLMQNDCNLVLDDAGNLGWAIGTAGFARDCHCTLQGAGNLVISEPGGSPVWSRNISGDEGDNMLLKDGKVVIYGGFLWACVPANRTECPPSSPWLIKFLKKTPK